MVIVAVRNFIVRAALEGVVYRNAVEAAFRQGSGNVIVSRTHPADGSVFDEHSVKRARNETVNGIILRLNDGGSFIDNFICNICFVTAVISLISIACQNNFEVGRSYLDDILHVSDILVGDIVGYLIGITAL